MPVPSGSWRSTTSTSGRMAGRRRVASATEEASPITVSAGLASITVTMPRRTTSWSSTSITRIGPAFSVAVTERPSSHRPEFASEGSGDCCASDQVRPRCNLPHLAREVPRDCDRGRARPPRASPRTGSGAHRGPEWANPAAHVRPVTLDVDRTPAASMLLGTRAILLISALVLTVLEFQLDASLLSPALPQMAASLGVSIAEISNVRSAFFLAASVLGMVISRWSDTIGRHRALFVHQDRGSDPGNAPGDTGRSTDPGPHPVSAVRRPPRLPLEIAHQDRKRTRLNSSHVAISHAVFCAEKEKAPPSVLQST